MSVVESKEDIMQISVMEKIIEIRSFIKAIGDSMIRNDSTEQINRLEKSLFESKKQLTEIHVLRREFLADCRGKHVHIYTDNALNIAVYYCNLDVVEFLIKNYADVNTVLRIATECGNLKVVNFLCEFYIDFPGENILRNSINSFSELLSI